MENSNDAKRFPCPLCGSGLEVRESKKQKPYVVCDSCGVQMFVRAGSGIERFEALIAQGEAGNSLDRVSEMEERYRKKCPKCGKSFWITPELMQTSWFNGELTGYRCPTAGCNGVAELGEGK